MMFQILDNTVDLIAKYILRDEGFKPLAMNTGTYAVFRPPVSDLTSWGIVSVGKASKNGGLLCGKRNCSDGSTALLFTR